MSSIRTALVAVALVPVLSLLSHVPAQAAGGGHGVALETPIIDTGSEKSLQRGAQTYMNYCMGCHGLEFHRYSRMARDLGLSDEEVMENLMFTYDENGEPAKIGSLMTNAMSREYGKSAFGVAPPDLSLVTRSRGIDWVYTYLKSFYVDPSRAGLGSNNTVFPDVGMPHVLWELQGLQKPIFEDVEHDGVVEHTLVGFEKISEGTLSDAAYDDLVADLTNFMAYVAEPYKSARQRMGVIVILFLLVLLVLSWRLKQEYWKDVH